MWTVLLCVTFVNIQLSYGQSPFLTDGHKMKLSDHFVTYGLECFSDYTITYQDVKALQAFTMPKGKDAPCFFACILKRARMLDAEGKMSPEAVLRVATDLFKNEDELYAVISVFQQCAYVNDLKVSDGAKGCDRAKFVLECIINQTKKEEQSARLTTPGDREIKAERSRSLTDIFRSVLQGLIRIGCSSVSKSFLPGNILTRIIPGLDIVSGLCNLLV